MWREFIRIKPYIFCEYKLEFGLKIPRKYTLFVLKYKQRFQLYTSYIICTYYDMLSKGIILTQGCWLKVFLESFHQTEWSLANERKLSNNQSTLLCLYALSIFLFTKSFLVVGTKFDFLVNKKNAKRNNHQKEQSVWLKKFSTEENSNKMSGVIALACLT